MTDSYQCNKCNETLYRSENRLSPSGYMIPLNFYDGIISKRGENHICPKDIRMPKPEIVKTPYVNEKSKDLGDYMKNMAKLGADNYWHLWIDGKYRGPVEKAKPEDCISWSPSQESVIKRP